MNSNPPQPSTLIFNPCDLNNLDNGSQISPLDPDTNFLNDFYTSINTTSQYHTVESFNKSCSTPCCNTLSLFHLNVRSLPCHFDELNEYISSLHQHFTVIALTETWLTENIAENYSIPGYNSIHHCRKNRSGGGVSLYIRNDMYHQERGDLEFVIDDTGTKSISIEIIPSNPKEKKTILSCVYRPPNTDIIEFNERIKESINNINRERATCYIIGDFNINLLNNTNQPTTDHINEMFSSGFYPLICRPTRITPYSATLIDNIYTNSGSNNIKVGILITDISDHFPIFLSSELNEPVRQADKISYRQGNTTNIRKFTQSLSEIVWSDVLNETDTEKAYNQFLETYGSLYEKCFPKKTTKISQHSRKKPWLSSGLLKSIRRKNKLYTKYVKNPTPLNHSIYKKYRNKLNHLLKTTKKDYYHKKFNEATSNIKQTWSLINEVINRNKSNSAGPNKIQIGTKTTENKDEICNEFNDFFINIGPTLESKIPKGTQDPLSYITLQVNSNLSTFVPPTDAEITDIVKNLKDSAAGHDEISPKVLKLSLPYVIAPLTHILSLSLQNGIVPHPLKVAKVTPIFKSSDPLNVNNYRPISVLPCISKVLEKLVYSRLLKHLNQNNILYKHQYGFRKGYSTSLALIHLMEKISTAIDNSEYTIGIFLDLSKAFDTVNHSILLNKLKRYGICDSAIKWFSSYLSNRQQYVALNDNKSQPKIIECGVPQGSILGPLLFLIYINDLEKASSIIFFILFADDSNLFLSNSNFDTLVKLANEEMKKVMSWFEANKLSVNVKKTYYLIFCNRNKTYNKSAKIFLKSVPLSQESQAKFLGIIIDDRLTWKSHITMLGKKISKTIGIIGKLKHILTQKNIITIYNSLIYPYLTYGNIVWGCAYKTTLQPLILLQKRFVRSATGASFHAHSAPLFTKLKILNIFDINRLHLMLFTFKFLNCSLPETFNGLLNLNSHFHNYQTRQSAHFHIPLVRTSVAQMSVKYKCIINWNNLPLHLKCLTSIISFKRNLKNHLLSFPTDI